SKRDWSSDVCSSDLGDAGVAATPFFDSYHQHEIKTDAIVWKTNEPFVSVKMMSGAGKAPATFTSSNFFRKGELEKFQGVMDFNRSEERRVGKECRLG